MALQPVQFRAEFGEEMRVVFSEALADVHRQGRVPALNWCCREFISLITLIIREHWFAWGREKTMMKGQSQFKQDADRKPSQTAPPPSWRQTGAAVLPFLLFGSLFVIKGLDYHLAPPRHWDLTRPWQLAVLLLLLAGMGVGWAKQFPRWSVPFLGAALVASANAASSTTYGAELLGAAIEVRTWGWRAWLPFLLTVLIMLLITRSRRPLYRLFGRMQQDWTRLSFLLYTMFTWLILAANYDSKTWYVDTRYLPFNMLVQTLIFAAGAILYMRLQRPWPRALALYGTLFLHTHLASAISALAGQPDIDSHQSFSRWLLFASIWLVYSLIPLLPGLIHHAWRRIRTA
jgi:hypothetical protein